MLTQPRNAPTLSVRKECNSVLPYCDFNFVCLYLDRNILTGRGASCENFCRTSFKSITVNAESRPSFEIIKSKALRKYSCIEKQAKCNRTILSGYLQELRNTRQYVDCTYELNERFFKFSYKSKI